jgi:hypothetical protein
MVFSATGIQCYVGLYSHLQFFARGREKKIWSAVLYHRFAALC